MGRIHDYLIRKLEKRSSLNVSDPNHWLIQAMGASSGTAAGINVTPETALATSAVFACVRVIAETIASLPCNIYRRSGDGKTAAPDHPLYPLLHDIGPNPWQSAPEFWENCLGHNVLRGNAYNFIVRNGTGIVGLVPLNPSKVEVKVDMSVFDDPSIIYRYTTPDSGKTVDIPASDIWHLKGISTDGFQGISPLMHMREAVGLAAAAESHGSVYFKNGAKPSGVVSYPGNLKEDAFKRFKESLQEAISGSNRFKALVLEQGATWSQVGMSNEDSQFLETRQFQVEDIARFFRVPTILIGHPDKTSTYASAEQFMLSFVQHTIRPWLVRIEKSILKHLMTESDQKTYFAEFKVDGLLRGDIKSRYDAYAVARQNTWMSANEIRALENMNPIDGGDVYQNPNITTGDNSTTDEDE